MHFLSYLLVNDLSSNSSIHPLIHNISQSSNVPPTSVASNQADVVALWLFDRYKQRGCAGHHDGHVKGRTRELWAKHLEDFEISRKEEI